MAAIQTHDTQTNFLSGVLDPRTQGRVDTSAYASSLLTGQNIELVHLGGVQRRRGSSYVLTCPNQLVQLQGTYTTPNGGTPGNLSDDNPVTASVTTTPPGTTATYVVCHVDLGSAQNVVFADFVAGTLAGGASTEFCIQFSNDDATWTTLGTNFPQLDSTAEYTYRRTSPLSYANSSPANLPLAATSARFWRVAKIGGVNLTFNVTLGDFTLWADSGVVSEGRLFSFEVSTTEQYCVTMSDRSAIVTVNGSVFDFVAVPYKSADLPLVDAQSSAESMMIVHESYAPQFLIRLSSTLAPPGSGALQTFNNFQTFIVVFDAIPQVDFGDALSPPATADIQALQFNNGWVVGDTFTITLLTDTTGPITYSGDNSTTANNIAVAVQALWAVNGFTGVSCTSNGSFGYTLKFAAAAAGPYGALAITSLSSNATATATETQVGVSQQENAWSAVRGYPGTVTFYQGRLWFGGLQSQQETLIGSWVNDILNFETAQGLDDQAVYVTMSGVALNAVNGMFPARSLCVFTTGGEYRFVNDSGQAITPTSFPTFQTGYGGAHIKPVMIDGNVLFVQRNGNSIRDFQFDYTQDQFNSLGVSALAPNLIYDVQDLAAWNGSSEDEINLVFVCCGENPNSTDFDAQPDGAMAIYNTRKEVNVQGWTNWITQGLYKNVCSVVQSVFFLVQRVINGVTVLTMEEAVEGTFMDCGFNVTNSTPASTVTGANWLNGIACRVMADGFVCDDVTPVNGTINITRDGQPFLATNVEVGLNFNPTVTPMPLQTVRFPAGTNLAHKKRIVKMRIKVRETLGLLYNGKVLPTAQIDNFNFDSPQVPFSGLIRLEDTTNWDETEDKVVTFTQVDPLPFYLMFMDIQLSGEQ
jgi:hypothetical protein